jgi:hypothetical protein
MSPLRPALTERAVRTPSVRLESRSFALVQLVHSIASAAGTRQGEAPCWDGSVRARPVPNIRAPSEHHGKLTGISLGATVVRVVGLDGCCRVSRSASHKIDHRTDGLDGVQPDLRSIWSQRRGRWRVRLPGCSWGVGGRDGLEAGAGAGSHVRSVAR